MTPFDITFEGKLTYVSDYPWDRLEIVQADGYQVNLLTRFQEVVRSFGPKASCSYFVSAEPLTEEMAIRRLIERCAGEIVVAQDANDYFYSEYTYGVDYEQTLKVGNHDLFRELREHDGKHIVFRIHVLPK